MKKLWKFETEDILFDESTERSLSCGILLGLKRFEKL